MESYELFAHYLNTIIALSTSRFSKSLSDPIISDGWINEPIFSLSSNLHQINAINFSMTIRAVRWKCLTNSSQLMFAISTEQHSTVLVCWNSISINGFYEPEFHKNCSFNLWVLIGFLWKCPFSINFWNKNILGGGKFPEKK